MRVHFSNTSFGQARLQKVRAVAQLTKTAVAEVAFDEKSGVSKTLPFFTLPLLETPQGVLFSTNTIIRYLANTASSHYGSNPHEQALVDQWLDIIGYDLEPAVYSVALSVSGKEVDTKKTRADVTTFLTFVNNHLNGKKFLVGSSLTIADVSLLSNLTVLYAHLLGKNERKSLKHLNEWFTANGSIFGETKFVDNAHASFAEAHEEALRKGSHAEKKADKKAEKKEEVAADFDPFADDAPAEKPAEKKPVEKPAAAKKKKEVIAKSIVVFDVKVYEQEEDLEKLAHKIYAEVKLDGLVWNNEHKILPVAFGMNKLQLGCVIEDAKVNTDDIFDLITVWEDVVQSIDTVAFQKV